MSYTPLDFARNFMGEHKIKGDEIVPKYCPICKGGQKHDKYTFALNMSNKTYNCMRASCGVQGHFSQLCRDFGVQAQKDDYYIPPRRIYDKPKQQPKPAIGQAVDYLQLRKISSETMNAYKVSLDDSGNIMFPHYNDKLEHVFSKFRPAKKITPGERKAWRDAGTMPVLYGMWKCDYEKPLVITEGEIDALSCHEAGIPNACSVPSGADDFTWLDTCWDFVQRFSEIYIFGDNDVPGLEMIKRLCVKLSDKRIFVVEHECKDANELLYRKGAAAVKAAYDNAKEVPVIGLVRLADVMPLDLSKLESVGTSLKELDSYLGGFMFGDVTVWSGKRGEGKSTLLSNIMLDAVDENKKVCAYSGELRADRFQYWTDLQAAGKGNIKNYYNEQRSKTVYFVESEIKAKIHQWYADKYWLYDNLAATSEEDVSILRLFEKAAKRYDCRVFMVDNLMTADYGKTNDDDFYRNQSSFVGKLVEFANRHNVHVHLVAHPRKTGKKLEADDVSGSGDITNRAANVITLERTPQSVNDCDLILSIKKNRWEGKQGTVKLNYCDISHRIFEAVRGDKKAYGWVDNKNNWFREDYGNEPLPF